MVLARVRYVARTGLPVVVAVSTRSPSRSSPTVTLTRSGVSSSRTSYLPETSLNGET